MCMLTVWQIFQGNYIRVIFENPLEKFEVKIWAIYEKMAFERFWKWILS